jgi:hypothetical protein
VYMVVLVGLGDIGDTLKMPGVATIPGR